MLRERPESASDDSNTLDYAYRRKIHTKSIYFVKYVGYRINTAHFLSIELTYDASMTRELIWFGGMESNRHLSWAKVGDRFMDHKGWVSQFDWQNTYDWGSFLDRVIQYRCGYDTDNDLLFVVMQTHNGVDVKSGYSRPRIFQADPADHGDWWTPDGRIDFLAADCGCLADSPYELHVPDNYENPKNLKCQHGNVWIPGSPFLG